MILVFKTSVNDKKQIKKLLPLLNKFLVNSKWNFDLEDCDKILRVDSPSDISCLIISLLKDSDFNYEELPE